ncbi:MAG: S9 family peptidase [Bdellovibrionales bacterium]|nr:S9 family peptidase [Bdellovibrionales bacterium]
MVHFLLTKIEVFILSISRELFDVGLIFGIVTMLPFSAAATQVPPDPFYGLEDIEGEGSMAWVRGQNQKTTDVLEADPAYRSILADMRGILFASDRVPFSSFHKGYFWNFWQDEAHKHGVIRRTSLEEYKKESPSWDVILDLDKLSQAEGENWVYKGYERLTKNSQRLLITLSRGGKDASVVREFDLESRQFVADGFFVPEAKSSLVGLDENTVLIAGEFGKDSLTKSGYPRTVRLWHRGQSLDQAVIKFEVKESDIQADSSLIRDGNREHVLFHRITDFYKTELFIQGGDGSLRQIPKPLTSSFLGIKENYIFILLKEKLILEKRTIPVNSIVRFNLEATSLEGAETVFTAGPRQSIEDVQVRKNRVFVNVLDNIRGKILDIKLDQEGKWESRVLPFPSTGIISFDLKSDEEPADISTMTYTDHLTPTSQYLVKDEDDSFKLELIKKAPDRFDASKYEVVQYFARSSDRTEIPYFVLKPKDMAFDGSHPTIQYGYGGFETSLAPYYSASIGKIWLERGGVYVIANIRGGGEFGPEWHQAALRENRQVAFDDFIAVSRDLIDRKITSPEKLGIEGGSNGGLLVGATMVQRPELYRAALAQVPLLDMVKYSKLLAGASWMAEYGDPDDPKQCAYLLKYSPYHNLNPKTQYPQALFTTSTKDDRVHPGHARKMAARMLEQGHPVFYYENINGGHAGRANLEETAHVMALEYTYLWNRLR